MPNYKLIADRATEIIGSADPAQYQAAFDVMVDETVTETQDIETVEIKQYLILTDKWLPIKASTEIPAQVTMDALSVFDSFRLTDPVTGPTVAVKLGQMMDALVSADLINAQDKAVIMSMGEKTADKWPGLKAGEVQTALRWRSEGEI